MSIKVGVRLRPFNKRELEMKSENIIKMEGERTILTNPQTGKINEYVFDCSMWSFDGYEEDEDGYCKALTDKYMDQKKVYEQMGKQIVDDCLKGYHCCLFAYGQTGSGKSYSMMGTQSNRGMVPTSLKCLFQNIEEDQTGGYKEVMLSMLEIYNEKVHDLLVDASKRTAGGLKVREHKVLGIFIEDISKYTCKSFQ